MLPSYGWIGVISHILTTYQVICFGLIRSPIMPWKELDHNIFDVALNIISLLVTIPIAIWTIARCRQSWELALVAVWMTAMMVTQGRMAIHAAIANRLKAPLDEMYEFVQRTPVRSETTLDAIGRPFWWLILYILGIVFGLVGIFAIAIKQLRAGGQEAQNVRIVTGSFGGFVGLMVLIGIIVICCGEGQDMGAAGMGSAFVVGVIGCLLAAFYSDLIIAAVANYWSGAPHRHRAAYWIFFMAKRFPLASV